MGPAQVGVVGLFDGLATEERAVLAEKLQRRLFRPGEDLLREGQPPSDILVFESGVAEVSRTNSLGLRQHLSRMEAGATCGEVSLLTGNPVSASVTAVTEVTALVLTGTDFVGLAARFPAIYRNVGAIRAQRLVHADRRTPPVAGGRLIWVVDHDAPPLVPYALACSVAWHTRQQTVLLVADSERYVQILGSNVLDPLYGRDRGSSRPARALVDQCGPLTATGGAVAEALRNRGIHVLVMVRAADISTIHSDLVVHIARPDLTLSSVAAAGRLLVRAWSEHEQAPRSHGSELFVPKPNGSDRDSLTAGLLSLDTAMGRALGRVARGLCGLRVGLALGEGSAKGFAHLGVVRSLERARVPCDCIAGTSIGAAVAGMLAAGFSVDVAQAHLARGGSATFRPVLPKASLMSHAGVARIMRAVWGDATRIQDLPTPLAMVAADIVTGREVVLNRGLLWAAALASISIPGIYPPQRMGERLLVDGGVVDPVPSGVVRSLGADVVIAVRLSERAAAAVEFAEAVEASGKVPSVVHTI